MNIALAQIDTTVGDFEGNSRKILECYRRASAAGAGLVLFPELCVTGYPPRDLVLRPAFIADNLAALDRIAARSGRMPAVIGFVDRVEPAAGHGIANAAAVVQDGKIVARVHKTLLPTYDVFDEDRYFRPGERTQPVTLSGLRVGITICEDIWNDADFWPKRLYDRDPVAELKEAGIDLLVNISASPWHLGKLRVRQGMLETIAKKDRLPLAYCNAVGGNDELIFDGTSLVYNRRGELTAFAKPFEEDLLITEIDSNKAITLPDMADAVRVYMALKLGLRDYVTKCGFKSVVLGLSGGIDSAVTAALAADALGAENVLGVAMPSKYSSDHSLKDSEALAKNLQIRFEKIPIQESVDAIGARLKPVFGTRPEDSTEENLQSRMRGLILMALSNKLGSLVLTTGNKSELATGYCTLYGDMCGGLAVLSDVPKMMVYELARHINRDHEIIPKNTIVKPPSAELRFNQTDQDTLPPYEILDRILRAYVEEHRPLHEIVRNGFQAEMVKELVRKIDRNEYKRRQAAPGLKVTSRAFGIGRRMPIAQKYTES